MVGLLARSARPLFLQWTSLLYFSFSHADCFWASLKRSHAGESALTFSPLDSCRVGGNTELKIGFNLLNFS